MSKVDFLRILKSEMIPALGCTEPACAALAGAKASQLLCDENITEINVSASHDMIKNAMGVSIPGFQSHGVAVAVAIGAAVADITRGLAILTDIPDSVKTKALSYSPHLSVAENVPSLYISVSMKSKQGNSSCAIISGEHTRFVYLEKNGKTELDIRDEEVDTSSARNEDMKSVTLRQIVEFATEINVIQLDFIRDAVCNNMKLAEMAVKGDYGLNVGKNMLPERISSLNDAFAKASSLAAAASDARMNGCTVLVIINSGSGNQGITVTVPPAVIASYLGLSEEKMLRAVCISELVGLALTYRKSRLSALCGAFTASIGTACAYVYLLGGDLPAYDRVIANMVGNLSGVICDGAKSTCALKIYSCLGSSALSATLAVRGIAPGAECGIVGENSLESIEHLFRISKEGMVLTDKTIFDIMTKKC